MFDILAGGQTQIAGERLKHLGRLLSADEELMETVSEYMDI